MRYLLPALLIIVTFMTPSRVLAQDALGVGIIVGEPTGLSAKKWLSRTNAVDAAVAWSLNENSRFQVHADYLYHRVYLFETESSRNAVPVYFGIGGRMRFAENDRDDQLGVRFPLGIGKTLADAPIEFFLEVVPILDLVPATNFDLNGALGARFYFNR